MKKFWRIFLIILFPLGIVFCIGKALFSNKDFASFLGMVLILGIGVLLGVYLGNPEMVNGWIQTVQSWIGG